MALNPSAVTRQAVLLVRVLDAVPQTLSVDQSELLRIIQIDHRGAHRTVDGVDESVEPLVVPRDEVGLVEEKLEAGERVNCAHCILSVCCTSRPLAGFDETKTTRERSKSQ